MQILCCSASLGTSHAVDCISEISASFPLFHVSASFLHWDLGAEIKEKEGFGERKEVWNVPKQSHMSLEQRQRGGSEVWELKKAGRNWTWPKMITVGKHQPKIKVDFQSDLLALLASTLSVLVDCAKQCLLQILTWYPWMVFVISLGLSSRGGDGPPTLPAALRPPPWWVLKPLWAACGISGSISAIFCLFQVLAACLALPPLCNLFQDIGSWLELLVALLKSWCSEKLGSRHSCPPSHCFVLSQDMILILTHFLFRNNYQGKVGKIMAQWMKINENNEWMKINVRNLFSLHLSARAWRAQIKVGYFPFKMHLNCQFFWCCTLLTCSNIMTCFVSFSLKH